MSKRIFKLLKYKIKINLFSLCEIFRWNIIPFKDRINMENKSRACCKYVDIFK